jgi:hypothetical protein
VSRSKPDTSLVFVGAFLTAWGAAASVTADSWPWSIVDVTCALVGAWSLKCFADQAISWFIARERP